MKSVHQGFVRSQLALAVCTIMLAQPVHALEALQDNELSASTGEGIAFLPENFSVQLKGADGTADTGYARLIPVGPVSATAAAKGYKRADAYLYGLNISQSSKDYGVARAASDWGSSFGRAITSWGTTDNPWILRSGTDPIYNFAGASKNLSYLIVEAPFYNKTLPTAGSAASSAYNLKLNLWADIYQRDGTVAESGYNGLSNRLRMNMAWDGFSLNGSNIKIFQTLDGVTAANVNQGLSTSYNNTFGMAGLLRLNSGDTQALRATVAYGAVTRTQGDPTKASGDTDPNSTPSVIATYIPRVVSGFNNSICGTSVNNTGKAGADNPGQCLTQEGYRNIVHTATATNSWTPPTFGSVLRLSTQETSASSITDTPALGGAKPNFSNADGLYLYGVNANIVLGSLAQPLIFGSPDGSNFAIELTRIPNQPSVYKSIYTAYSDALGATTVADAKTYLGSTCNIYRCGTDVTLGGTTYQGSSATHSSISIGSTVYDGSTDTTLSKVRNELSAYKGVEAVGISFGQLTAQTGLSSTASVTYQQVYTRTRGCSTNLLGDCNGGWNGWGAWSQTAQTQFAQNSNTGPTGANPQVLRIVTNVPTNNTNNLTPPGRSVSNNMGSAVIDGLLIQHMKFTTTGLN